MAINGISANQALHYIESLRLGIPPNQAISYFTVGRRAEINSLYNLLSKPNQKIKLLQANYGSGKTHLLKLLREEALRRNFSVSLLTLDGKSGIRFSKLDEIFGSMCRNLAMPDGSKGVSGLFDAIKHGSSSQAKHIQQYKFYNGNRRSAPLQEALNWWLKYDLPQTRDVIVEWISNPYHFTTTSSQEKLYYRILNKTYFSSQDKAQLAVLRREGVFKWSDSADYTRTWAAFAEVDRLVRIAGAKGLILLIDEFEDVVTNLTSPQQRIAFSHLFSFYSGMFPGLTVFAVTPDFVEKCKNVLRRKGIWNYSVSDFAQLPTLMFSPLGGAELYEFSCRVFELYEHAYQITFTNREEILYSLRELSFQASRGLIPDLPRHIAKQATKILDAYLED